jgi:membrane protein DedA with SNARE-associated domain
MHHIGILAGAALLTGVIGNSLLYAVGLLLSIPLLNRLRKRFSTWKAPAIGVAVFTAMFLLSALVVGPAISRSSTPPAPQTSAGPASNAADHASHHGG